MQSGSVLHARPPAIDDRYTRAMARILVIDDEPEMRAVLDRMLRPMGHEVEQAANGNEGLRRFREQPFDLVITDLRMPERDGFETIRELRRLGDVKIIAMSAGGPSGPTTYLQMAKHVGAAAVLPKPFSRQELTDAIDVAVGK